MQRQACDLFWMQAEHFSSGIYSTCERAEQRTCKSVCAQGKHGVSS